jgi:hypothetical protein
VRGFAQKLINGLEFLVVGRNMGKGNSARRMLAVGFHLKITLEYIGMISVFELFFFRVLEVRIPDTIIHGLLALFLDSLPY